MFLVDWLHCCDQGIAADFLGNLFASITKKSPGNTKESCKDLFLELQAFYKANKSTSRLDNLTPTMIQKNGNSVPKLRGKAGEIRALIPFALEAAERHLDARDPFESTTIEAARQLNSCYSCLSGDAYSHATLKECCRRYCLLSVSLDETSAAQDSIFWRLKPKIHLFQELCEMAASNPSMTWVYRDEDVGGSLAGLARRRGGHNTPAAIGFTVLNKFRASYAMPSL